MAHLMNWSQSQIYFKNKNIVLLDLRSEKEFQLGHIPNAINIPLLDNQERHNIGLLYKTEGQLIAVQEGLELFAKKSHEFLRLCEEATKDADEIFVYCWRGGMRSQLVAEWLKCLRKPISRLEGGYKSYRQDVLAKLESFAQHPLLVLIGKTGSGKTQLIEELQQENLPAIDLEGLAGHRGSAFGGIGQLGCEVTQQNFENRIAYFYDKFCHSPKILIEIESNLGPVRVPLSLKKAITASPMIYLERSFEERVKAIEKVYLKNWSKDDDDKIYDRLELIRKFFSKEDFEKLSQNIHTKNYIDVIRSLLEVRYDKSYDKSLYRYHEQIIQNFDVTLNFKDIKSFIKKHL